MWTVRLVLEVVLGLVPGVVLGVVLGLTGGDFFRGLEFCRELWLAERDWERLGWQRRLRWRAGGLVR